MNLHVIETGTFRLDGGAMFGVVPKVLWQKTNPADESNRITLAMRCLLIEEGERLLLVDDGLGSKYDDKFSKIYSLDNSKTLESSLKAAGFSPDDVTDVLLTHLHFDHCGGSTMRGKDGKSFVPYFRKAVYYVQEPHWQWAIKPNAREKASFFLEENLLPLDRSGQLRRISGDGSILENLSLIIVNGHTRGQQLPVIRYKDKTIVYVADLIPTHGHIPVPYIMGYDISPLDSMEEKEKFLSRAAAGKWVLFFERDPFHECATVERKETGGYKMAQPLRLAELKS